MSEFNRMTIVAAAEVVSEFHSHGDLSVLEVQWGIDGRCSSSGKSARVADLSRIAVNENPHVLTAGGRMTLSRALIELAIDAPNQTRESGCWRRFVAGLRFVGFEIDEQRQETHSDESSGLPTEKQLRTLRRMLPTDAPQLDFREAESEVARLLDHHGLATARGHLAQAVSAFQRGEWSSANGELRNFFESYLNEIALAFGYSGSGESKEKRDYLGHGIQPAFLLADYNEWNSNSQKPQYVQGLMSRMHPHGGHPGLSEEEDATFRLQITLVTARLFLRRYDQRKATRDG